VSVNFYVYVWYRADTGIPIYVGKGYGNRWKTHLTRSHNSHVHHALQKHGGWCEFYAKGLSDSEAQMQEISLISKLGRRDNGGLLYNLTDGGDGAAGYRHTLAERNRRSARLTGTKRSPETIMRMKANKRLFSPSPETREKLRIAMLIRYADPAERQKTRLATKASNSSQEIREKIGYASKIRYEDPINRKKLSDILIGRVFSHEHCLNLSNAIKKAWTNPEFRTSQQTIWSNPDNLKHRGDAIKRGWDKPDLKERMSAERKLLWAGSERRERASAENKKFWAENPELLAKRGEAIRAGKARKKIALAS